MHFAAFCGIEWTDYLQRMRDGVKQHGPVRAGIYAMLSGDRRQGRGSLGPCQLVFAGVCSHAPGHHRPVGTRRSGIA